MTYGGSFDLESKETALAELEQRMASPGFWDQPEAAREIIEKANQIKSWTEPWRSLAASIADLTELAELLADAEDEELSAELDRETGRIEDELTDLELRNMLRGPDAHRSALLTVHPGAGGTESQDWAEMLLRMYSRYAERRGYKVQVLELQPGEEAGIKSATLEILGDHAFGYLGAETGVHRLVRISPFDAQGRRHTSFASVFVYPEVDDDVEIEIDESDLRIDTYRASGAGGQHVNKTDSAVRITHEPTGVVVSCQQERSQHKNRAKAMKMLQAALYQRAMEEKEAEKQALEDSKSDIAWGNQIRSYVLQPYTMVKDHRTSLEVGNADGVLDGDIQRFIEAFLRLKGASG
ncbi:MAG: peptide chain release factor 2 [Candidatus Palauibacterales bacterium]|nr:peptide chain release factor 2 [Candidatus Palauibacterales bacterium]MDP2483402.1 peptide chain release factor 2 [Candidatus Palauibacterales bacterium]